MIHSLEVRQSNTDTSLLVQRAVQRSEVMILTYVFVTGLSHELAPAIARNITVQRVFNTGISVNPSIGLRYHLASSRVCHGIVKKGE